MSSDRLSDGRYSWMEAELRQQEQQAQRRSLRTDAVLADGWLCRDGRRMLNLASNDYLGLSRPIDAELMEQFTRRAEQWGSQVRTGAAASRLVVGSDPLFAAFETEWASFKGREAALLFGSGYTANVGIMSALAGRRDLVFSDRLNHASIIDGIVLSRAEHIRYRNRDMDQLERLLASADPQRRKLIVSDAVFSMDGSIAPLHQLVELKERYGALLVLDEAHSGGLFGERGEGLAHELGLQRQVDVLMGTFSKAYGCAGAYAAADRVVIDYLVQQARSFIYTTAMPPVNVLSIWHNWELALQQPWRKERLLRLSELFREGLVRRGFDIGESECHIVPLYIGSNEAAVRFGELLQQAGIAAVPIRPPTVPDGTARIRFTLMATHREEDLLWALDVIGSLGAQMGLVRVETMQ